MLTGLELAKKAMGGDSQPPPPTGQWSKPLFNCDNVSGMQICASFCCPCAAIALVSTVMEGNLSPKMMDVLCSFAPCMNYFHRRRVSGILGIKLEETWKDCLIIMFCLPCSLIQVTNEVVNVHKEKFLMIGAAAVAANNVGKVASMM